MRHALFSVLAALALFIAAPVASAQTFSDADWSDAFALNGAEAGVYASALGPDGHVYFVGDFEQVSGVLGTMAVARYNTKTQRVEALREGLYGRAEDLAFLSDGTLVVVGNFSFRNSASEAHSGQNVALWDGASWSAPGGGTAARIQNGAVASAVVADGTHFYVGGNFFQVTQPSGTALAAIGVARWNGSAWEALGTPGFGMNGTTNVKDLLLDDDGTLLVAGLFDVVYASDGTQLPLRGVARWDETAGAWTGGFGDASIDRRNGAENAAQIVKAGNDYYVLGNGGGHALYQSDGSVLNVSHVGKWDGTAWSPLGAGGGGFPPNDGVDRGFGLHVTPSGDLVVIGAETAYDGAAQTTTGGFARWDGSGWSAHLAGSASFIEGSAAYSEGLGSAVTVGSDFYAFGPFTSVTDAGGTTETLRAVRWDGSAWHALGASSHGGIDMTNGVTSDVRVAADDEAVYVAGQVRRAGSTELHGFGRYDRASQTWTAPGALINTGQLPFVKAIVWWGDRLVIGGRFDRAENPDGSIVHSQNVIAWNTATQLWESFGDGSQSASADRNGVEGEVRGIAVLPSSDLALAGNFSEASQADGTSLAVQNVVLWDASASAWAPLASGAGDPVGVNKDVLAIAADASGRIVVGGAISEATQPDGSEISTNGVVRWDGEQWETLGDGLFDSSDNAVEALAVSGEEIYAAGELDRRALARWDGVAWNDMGGRFDVLKTDAELRAVHVVGGNAIVGGRLERNGRVTTPAWTDETSSVLMGSDDGGYLGGFGVGAHDFAQAGSSLFMVGGLNRVGGEGAIRLAEFTALPAPTRLPAPLLTGPDPLGAPTSLTLTWSAISGATSYDVQVATSEAFEDPIISETGLAAPSYAASGLAAATRYFVRLRSSNASATSIWSQPVSFYTLATSAPGAVTLVLPADAAQDAPALPTLVWNAADQAFGYEVEVASDGGFAAPLFSAIVTGDTSASVTPALPLSSTAYWRVRASNNIGDGPWSAIRSFTTAASEILAPVLTNPADLAENQSTNPYLYFERATGAGQYRVQLAEISGAAGVPDWSTAELDEVFGNQWSTNYRATGLTSGTRYAWRVQGIDFDGAAGPWSDTRRFKTSGTNPAAPATPVQSSPAHYASSIPIPPTLEWQSVAAATRYRVQVSTSGSSSSFENALVYDETAASASATLYGASLSTNTYYYWRVRAENAYEGGWSGIWRFRTTSVILPVPTLASPDADAAEVAVRGATLTWNAAESYDDYEVQMAAEGVGGEPDFGDPAVRAFAFDATDYTITALLDGGGAAYWWRVRTRVSSSSLSAWSAPRRFTTSTAPTLAAPDVLSPSDGGTIRYKYNTPAPYVTWLPVEGALGYQLQFTSDGSFTDEGVTGGVIERLAWVDDGAFWEEYAGRTAMRVRTVNEGGAGDWSAPVAFTVATVSDGMPFAMPNAQTHSGDIDDDLGHGTRSAGQSGTFRWYTSFNAFTDLNIATDRAFTNVVASASNVPADEHRAEAPYSGLARATRYYFRLRPSGGAWSSTMFFDTGDGVPNEAPALILPEDAATAVASRPTFEWNAAAEASTYDIQVATDPGFSAPVLSETGLGTSFTPSASLAFLTTHYWRVRGVGESGAGPWSDARSFTTIPPPPPAPTLLEPTAGATGVPIATALVWTKPTGAQRIHYEVARDAAFADRVTFNTFNEGRGQRVTGLPTGTLLYVRLRAEYDEGALSEWSPASTFTTEAYDAPTAAPTLIAPADAASGTGAPIPFTWNPVSGADRYQIHVATGPDFGEGEEGEGGGYVAHNRTGVETTSTFDFAQANATYWWRVRAIEGPDGSDAAGPWSAVRSFGVGTIPALTTAPVQTEPADGATGVHQLTTFGYQPLANAQAYHVEVSQSSSFTKPLSLYSSGSATEITTFQAFDGGDGQTWYWRVRGRNNSGGWGPWSGAFSFQTTAAAPPTASPRITRPDFTGVAPRNPLLVWDEIKTATSYDVEVGTTFEFGTILSSTNVPGTSTTLTGLTPGVRYYARVRGRNAAGAGPWSQRDFVPRAAQSAEAPIAAGDPPPMTLPDAGGVEVDFSSLRSDATLSAERVQTEPPGGFAVGEGVGLTTTQYWTFSLEGGGTFATSVCFPISEVAGPVTDFTQLTIYKREGEGDAWVAQATELRPPEAPTQICVPSISSFSDFAIGAPEAALPVELTAFTASVDGERVHLEWVTATETNNAGFAIERRDDADAGWAEVGTVVGHGTTSEPRAYTFTDSGLPYEAAALRYRLRQTDYDGAVQYSAEIEVEPGLPTDFALEPAFPNPTRGAATLRYALPTATTVSLDVFDALGRRVLVLVAEEQEAGRYAVPVDTRTLASGVYFVRLRADGQVAGQRITVLR